MRTYMIVITQTENVDVQRIISRPFLNKREAELVLIQIQFDIQKYFPISFVQLVEVK